MITKVFLENVGVSDQEAVIVKITTSSPYTSPNCSDMKSRFALTIGQTSGHLVNKNVITMTLPSNWDN